MIEFQLDAGSGVATYLQLVQQVHQALQLGLLEPGDQLPTAQQVVARLAINPNTVLKAYRDLEREGLVRARPGQGTFVIRSLPRHRPRRPGAVPRLDDRVAALGAVGGPWTRRHRGDLPHRVPQLLRGGCRMTAVDRDQRRSASATAGAGRSRLHARHPRRAGRRARRPERRRQDDPAAAGRRAARADVGHDHGPRRAPGGSPGAARAGRLRRPGHAGLRAAVGRRRTCGWAPGSTRAGTARLAERRIASSASTRASAPGRSPAASGPSSRSRWRSPSGPSCSCSTSRWRASTRSPGASSCRA